MADKNETLEKRCSKCGIVKSKREFTPRKDRACGTRSRCKPCEKPRYARWRNDNIHRARGISRRYYHGKGRVRLSELRKSSINYRILDNLRRRINKTVRRGGKSQSTQKLLGCSIQDFRIYLESLWESGMSWDNYGRNGWHIDHIIPCSLFDLSRPDHQKRCFHFSNMQPLWAPVNLSKHNKYLFLDERKTPWIDR